VPDLIDPSSLQTTNQKVAQTLRKILKPGGKLLLLTSTTVEPVFQDIYVAPPLGPLRPTSLKVEHGQLSNSFGSWGSWDGAENFGLEN